MEQKEQSSLNKLDRGIGTPYERISLWDFFDRLNKKRKINSVLELPRDGMYGIMGLNSMHFACSGRKTTMFVEGVKEREFVKNISKQHRASLDVKIYKTIEDLKKIPDNSYDLVFAFNVLSGYPNMQEIIEQMGRISNKYVFFTYMNKYNYGYLIHRAHHKKNKEAWNHTDLSRNELNQISNTLEDFGFRNGKKVIIDAPWWPDIGAPIGDVVGDLMPFLKKNKNGHRSIGENYVFSLNDLPYFDQNKYGKLKNKMSKDFVIEKFFPHFIRILFAHHIGVIFAKDQS